jgi:1-deoxyxylulose-5-phosphate synthase
LEFAPECIEYEWVLMYTRWDKEYSIGKRSSMLMRQLGKSGISISAMGFGCGGYWGYPSFNELQAAELVQKAIEGGVNFLDTGASYSGGNAEIRLGRIIKSMDTTGLIISTKAGTVIHNGRLVKDYSPSSLKRQVESSLVRLGLEQLPLLQLHGVPVDGFNEAFDTLAGLKQSGKVRLIGVSGDGRDLERALNTELLDVVMLTYNLLHRSALQQVRIAYENGCGVLVKSPMAHTLYSNRIFKLHKVSDLWYLLRVIRNYPGELLDGRKFRFINHIPGWVDHEIALLYALHDMVSCVVTGTTNLDHMQGNLRVFNRTLPVEIRQLIDAVKE